MLLNDFIDIMNKLAPQETALGFDNVGLIIGTDRKQIKRVLVALDCTLAVAHEAVEIGADLVLTHHPLLFSTVKRISPECPQTAAVYTLIRNGIALFSAHTNLDAAEGGVNTELCRLFGLQDTISVGEDSIMRVGNLPETMMLDDFAAMVQKKLNTVARISGSNTPVSRIAVIGGSGGAEYEQAHEAGAQVLVTGECKHSDAIAASVLNLNIIAAGHYQTENPVLIPLAAYLRSNTEGVEYMISKVNTPTFRTCGRCAE